MSRLSPAADLKALWGLTVVFGLLLPSVGAVLANCNPGRVTCCLTVDNALHKVYVDGVDVTAYVEPQDAFLNWRVAKTITFDEPMHTATLAIEGFEYNSRNRSSIESSGLQLSCVSTRPDSPWNFVSQPDSEWSSVIPISRNRWPENWLSPEFSLTSPVVESRSLFSLDWSRCSAVGISADAIARSKRVSVPNSPSGLFTFRRTVVQNGRCEAEYPNDKGTLDKTNVEYCGIVTCCLTVDNELVSVYVNGHDVTRTVSPKGKGVLESWRATKVIRFVEPSSWRISLGILGKDVQSVHSPDISGIQLMCTATRPNSKWNNVASDLSLGSWRAVNYSDKNWFALDYAGGTTPAVASGSKFFIRDATCGPLNRHDLKIAAPSDSLNSSFFALRLDTVESSPCTPPTGDALPPATPFVIDLVMNPAISESSRYENVTSGGWKGRNILNVEYGEVAAMNNAKAFWERVITRSYPTSACIAANTTVCGVLFSEKMCFEDILVIMAASDSLGDKPVETSICAVDPVGRSRIARVIINREYSNSEGLTNLLKQALGHAIGFGTLWQEFKLLDTDNKYIGANVIAETKAPVVLDKTKSPPIHWSTSVVGEAELFTSQISTSRFLSRISLLSLMDIRLAVDLNAASTLTLTPTNRQVNLVESGDVVRIPSILMQDIAIKSGRDYEALDDERAKTLRENTGSSAERSKTVKNQKGLSVPALVGIVVGIVVGLAALALALFVGRQRRHSQPRRASSTRGLISRKSSRAQSDRETWIEQYDEENSSTYWVNRETNEFSWTNPLMNDSKRTQLPVFSEIAVRTDEHDDTSMENVDREAGSDWKMEEDEVTKARYYIKSSTGEFSWTMPKPQPLGESGRSNSSSSKVVKFVLE